MKAERVPLEFSRLPVERMAQRAEEIRAELSRRRSVRDFSSEPVPRGMELKLKEKLDALRAAREQARAGRRR